MSQPNSQFYQSPSGLTDSDSGCGSLSIESQQQVQRSPPSWLPSFSASSSSSQNIAASIEEYLLSQLLNESYNYPAFGFIMDKDGTIEEASGEVEQFLGLKATQLIDHKLMSFLKYPQQVCGFLPSANSGSLRKTTEVAFRHQNGQLFKMQFIYQAVRSNPDKPVVVCAARRVKQGPAFSFEIDRRTRTILSVDIQNNKFNLDIDDFLGKKIENLCHQSDKSVLDYFFDPRAQQCRADLSFKIRENVFSVEAVSKDFDGEKLKLDCTYINHSSNIESNATNNVDRKMSSVSDKNFNYQQPNLIIPNQMVPNNAFLDTSTAQQFQYPSFQITQQPQMQSSSSFVENQEALPIIEEEDSTAQPPKKTRKPRKPRNSNGTQNSKAKDKTTSAEKSDFELPSIQNQLDHQRNSIVAGAVYSEFSMTGQPYPTPMISNTMAFNPSFEYANLSSDQFTYSSQLPTIDEQDATVKKKRQRKPRNNSCRSKSQEEDQLLVGMLNNQAAGSVQATSRSNFANQSLSFDAGRSASTMSTSQVAYSMQTPINMQPMYNNAGPMNVMQVNGVPYQMNAMAAGQPSQVSWQNNGMMNNSQAPNEFHPMYQSQQTQMQMMYNQQQNGMGPTSLTQSSPVGKKPAAKRKSNQQLTSVNNAPMQPNKQHFMPNGMPQSNMSNNINGMISAQQHYQQFPQSNQMYNQQMMQHAPPINQQQMIAQQQQMMANGINSPQFSSPATPINYGQKTSEAVRLELRNTLQTRQNANSPSSQPNSTQMPHSVQQNVMPMSNEMNSRFPSSNESAPNLLSPPRLSNNSQQQAFGGIQPSAQQNLFNMQQAQIMNRHNGIVGMEKNDYHFSEFDLDQKPPSLFQNQDDLLHNDNTYFDFALLSGGFDLSNLETKSLVEKLLG